MEAAVNTQAVEKIKLKEKLAFGLGDVASNVVWSAIGSFLTFYYTNAVGIAAATAGTIFLVSRLLDGLSDILMGVIIDRTKSKHGKARPWLLWMAVPFFISTVLLFSVPEISVTGKIIYAFITYNIMSTVVYTAINLPYGLINTLATDDPKQRVHLNIFRMFGAMIMGTIANIIVIPLVNAVGGERGSSNPLAWTIVMGALGIIAMILFFICFKGTKERIVPIDKEKVSLKVAFPNLFKNKYWYICLINGIFLMISTNMMGANIYFAKYWLGDENMVGLLAMAMMPAMVVGLLAGGFLIGKMGKRNCIITGNIISAAGLAIILINPRAMMITIVGILVKSVGMGLMASANVLIADVIDYGEWKTGVRTDGITASASSFGSKVGVGLGAAIIGWGLALGNFDANLAVQSPGAMNAILALFAVVPLVVNGIGIVLMSFYDLDKKLPQIHKDMAQRRAAAVSNE